MGKGSDKTCFKPHLAEYPSGYSDHNPAMHCPHDALYLWGRPRDAEALLIWHYVRVQMLPPAIFLKKTGSGDEASS